MEPDAMFAWIAVPAGAALLLAALLAWRARRARAALRELLRGGDAARLPRWLQALGAEFTRCRQDLEQLDAAHRQATTASRHAEARSAAACELTRDAQLGLNQARAALEQLRAALPQRALQQNLERARARVELERLIETTTPALAALRRAGADAREWARAATAAQATALAATDALQLLAINARVALERGAADALADVAAELERRSAELGGRAERAVSPAGADAVVDAVDSALQRLDAAIEQARVAPAAPAAVDADLEADLAALARDLSNTMLQFQAVLRATAAVPQSEEAAVSPG
jgi:DNA repair exonuclease SbcCD ATPase subunit